MKILVACEFSGIVREAFKAKGHDAWSCDLLPTDIPGQHIQGDVLEILEDGWDMMIAHPPCTYLCRHRSRWNTAKNKKDIRSAKRFFMRFMDCKIPKICVENPVPLRAIGLPPYQQIIQPWQFGHDYSKRTCLWLKNLPPLKPTGIVKLSYYVTPNGRRFTKGWYFTPRNGKDRSRTFPGIAAAMAEQWGDL
ncbi:MAG: DNA cytosine methyltransferase [Planctomycetes bacterium]|nr:DNA cytosine methyltransferase [Planctomycetota bacterium]